MTKLFIILFLFIGVISLKLFINKEGFNTYFLFTNNNNKYSRKDNHNVNFFFKEYGSNLCPT